MLSLLDHFEATLKNVISLHQMQMKAVRLTKCVNVILVGVCCEFQHLQILPAYK